MEFTTDLLPYRDLRLDLDFRASEPYNSFVFEDEDEARRVQAYLFDAGVSDASPPHAVLTLDEGKPVALDSAFGWERFTELRAGAAVALARSGLILPDSATARRMQLADQVLFTPSQGDFYGSRTAVVPGVAGAAMAVFLMKRRIAEARSQGYRRYVGEIASHVTAMVRISTEAFGFEPVDVKRVDDEATGRSLELIHLARPMDDA